MPQHDYVIDNGPGGAVRTDLISALQALVSCNSGPLPPETTYAGMLWFDTSTASPVVKMRDTSNTAWVAPPIYGSDRVAEIVYFARSTPPTGWFKCDGTAKNRSTYAALFAAIGTQYGVGDGTTTFNIPDLRGRFIRTWDDSASVDPGRAFGSAQAHGVASHVHTGTVTINSGGSHAHSGSISGTAASAGAHTHSGSSDTEAAHAHSMNHTRGQSGTGILSFGDSEASSGGYYNTASGGSHAHALTINSGGAHTHTVSGSMTSDTEPAHAHTGSVSIAANTGAATETRPINVALLACIRYS